MHDQPNPPTPEETLLAFLERVTKATSLTDVNVAAGIARNEYLGLDPES
jgi:hypothetical protein